MRRNGESKPCARDSAWTQPPGRASCRCLRSLPAQQLPARNQMSDKRRLRTAPIMRTSGARCEFHVARARGEAQSAFSFSSRGQKSRAASRCRRTVSALHAAWTPLSVRLARHSPIRRRLLHIICSRSTQLQCWLKFPQACPG
jgi:hypothetical protein